MHFDRIVRTDIVADEGGVLATMRFDEEAIRAHLAAHGVEIGETAPRFGADGEGPSIYIHDPEGNTVELKGPPG